jgi:anti-sigma factor RsiW
MSCEDVNRLVEALASGELTADGGVAAHLASCPRCAARVARARAIDAALGGRPAPAPSARFTADVMARIRRDRWRAEQAVDVGFNVAVLAGAILVVGGLLGLAWMAGLAPVGLDLVTLVTDASTLFANRLASNLYVVMLAIVFLTSALGVWWWAEGDFST